MAVVTIAELKAKWTTGYEPTQSDYVDLFDTLSGGWQQKTLNLTQEDVREMASANDGFGYKMFDGAGANKIIQISNLIMLIKKDAGTFAAGQFSVINGGDGDDIGLGNISDSNTKACAFILADISNYLINQDIFLYGSDSPDFEGTAVLVCDYREIDFS